MRRKNLENEALIICTMCNIMCAIANFRRVHDKNVASAWIDFSRLRFFFSPLYDVLEITRRTSFIYRVSYNTFNLKFNDKFPVDILLKKKN